jgi:hypothetical protein
VDNCQLPKVIENVSTFLCVLALQCHYQEAAVYKGTEAELKKRIKKVIYSSILIHSSETIDSPSQHYLPIHPPSTVRISPDM